MNGSDEQPEPSLTHGTLHDVLHDILRGSWRFIQLRGTSLAQSLDAGELPSDEDIDLLGSEHSAMQLIQAVHEWCQQGRVHFWVERRRFRKIRLRVYSLDARYQVTLDLWIEIPQLPQPELRGSREELESRQIPSALRLSFESCRHLAEWSDRSVGRLPLSDEFCLYVCHLNAKRKNLSSGGVKARLQDYHRQLLQADSPELTELASRLLQTECLDSASVRICGMRFYKRLTDNGRLSRELITKNSGAGERWTGWLLYHWMQPPRDMDFVFLTGCDGAGKTAICEQLQQDWPATFGKLTGKHLYRKSLFYKLLVVLVRPLLFQDRERFDETMAPVAYMLASARLGLKKLIAGIVRARKSITLIDRSLLDFLIVGRKTGRPRLSIAAGVRNVMGQRYPVVHLHVAEQEVLKRKQEMSAESQRVWNELLFGTLIRSGPVSYVGLCNSGDLKSAVWALNRMLSQRRQAGAD